MAALDTPRAYFDEVVTEYRERRDALVSGLRAIGVDCVTPKGAFYLVAPLPVADADDFAEFLLKSFDHDGETVMVAPASGFYATPGLGKNEVRIAYVLGVDRLERSVAIIGKALDAYGAS
jgi:aspartate aminotransferase